jgi:hypothetical protein
MQVSAAVCDFSDHASDEALVLFFGSGRRRRDFAAFFERGENLLDFVVDRETASTRLRKDKAAIDDNIELA